MTTAKGIKLRFSVLCGCSALMLLCGLIVLIHSCERDNNVSYPGKKLGLHFTIEKANYGANKLVTRDHSDMNPETVVVPLGDDLYMYASLEADREDQTRAGSSPLSDGTKLRIVAYLDGSAYHAHADYTISNGALVSDTVLSVAPGNYKFVAYSFNSSTVLPVHSEILPDIDPVNDLLWGCYPLSGTYPVTETTHEEISITLSHLFAQATVQATTNEIGNIAITHIDSVSIIPGKKANLTVNTGLRPAGSDAAQYFSSIWPGINTATVTANKPRTVFTGDANFTTVNIGNLSLAGYAAPFKNLTATFIQAMEKGHSYTFKVSFKKISDVMIDDVPPANFLMWVGAFWKANQTGERLIRIQRPSNAADGPWTATVIVGNNWIVLDKKMTNDKAIWTDNPQHSGNDPGFDALYPVNSALTSVAGTLRAAGSQGYQAGDEYIYFRIGLKTPFQASASVPARYGMVLLTYKNNALKQRIWIRQGEGDDYLMTNSDPVGSGGITVRTVTRRFLPYNLTANVLDADAGIRGGQLVEYPTQTGAFFQWAHMPSSVTYTRTRWAWNPYTPTMPSSPNSATWQEASPGNNVFWETLKDDHETCPPGYRRPNDGSITASVSGTNLSNSELRQSLFRNPQTSFNYASNLRNCEWGYYADGFFDRRRLTNAMGAAGKTTVAAGTPNIAHLGRLFYNAIPGSSHYCASLFLPATGNRYQSAPNPASNGHFLQGGTDAMYWTASKNNDGSNSYGICLRIWDTHTGPWKADKGFGFAIRCVRDE